VDVVLGPDHRHATFVVVRLGPFRSSVVPVEVVDAVVPATQLVVLHSRRRRRITQVPWLGKAVEAVAAATPPAAAAFARACLRFGSAALLAAHRASTATWSATRRLARWFAPRAARAERAIARGGARLASLTATAVRDLAGRTRVLLAEVARRLAGALAAAAAVGAVLLDELAAAWVKRRAHDR
jgi:hypothetical protein